MFCPKCSESHIVVGHGASYVEWNNILAADAEFSGFPIYRKRKVDDESVERKIRYLLEREDDLDDWSREFVNSLANMEKGKPLSPKQQAKLTEVFERY